MYERDMKKNTFHNVITPLSHEVTIDEEIWNQHIIAQHPEMIGKMEDVLNILENPEFITFNQKYSTYNVFFENVMIAYKLRDRIQGIVLTAMKVKKTYKDKLRRLQIWP